MKPFQQSWLVGVAAVFLTGCGDRPLPMSNTWQTYENPRFGFELSYPRDWTSDRVPSNLDGQRFHHPKNPQVSVTAWAGYSLSGQVSEAATANFTTDEGVKGTLRVDVEAETTFINLTISDGGAIYYFEGRSPSEEFADYYRLFYDMASQYRIGEASADG